MRGFSKLELVASVAFVVDASIIGRQGTAGITTRYWDCCKASCSWNGKAAFSSPVNTCDINDNPLSGGGQATNGCPELGDGTAFMCSSQQPYAKSDSLAYGFAAVSGSQNEADTCCACYALTFQDQIAGKVMVVQASNIGYDVDKTNFDLAIPGGGVGAFPKGCQKQYNAPAQGWGSLGAYGGCASGSECSQLPARLQAGCNFRFDWMQGANNPAVTYQRVACPAELTDKTGCKRDDDGSYPPAPTGGSSPTPPDNGDTVPLYGQCGGQDYSGPTKCASGSTCQKQNDYYSQCL